MQCPHRHNKQQDLPTRLLRVAYVTRQKLQPLSSNMAFFFSFRK